MEPPQNPRGLSGNPVFDYKIGFRLKAAFVQKLFFNTGVIMIVLGVAGRFVPFKDPALAQTLLGAPVLGVAMIIVSGIWAYAWRSKLRNDFCREYALNQRRDSGIKT